MSVTTYRSTDAGAPALNGTSGNGLVNLFDICLAGTGTAYGALPKKGWTKLHSGTNKAVYRTVDGIGHLRVQHDGAQGAASFREALVRGAEGATDVDTLVDQFPSASEITAGNETWRTSDTADATARAWELVAGPNWLILSVRYGTNSGDMYVFGRFSAARSANSWPYLITVRNASNNSAEGFAASVAQAAGANFVSGAGRMFAMRSPDGLIKSPRAVFVTESAANSTSTGLPGNTGPVIPNGDGLIFMSPPQIWVNGGSGTTSANPQSAGFFPNLWSPMHNFFTAGRAAFYGDTFNAPGYAVGSQFVLRGPVADASGKWIIETTDTWQDPLA